MKFWQDKKFMKAMIAVALPIALQNLITSSLNMVDTLMISNLGQSSIAAVGLANQVFFFFALIIFGITSGSSIFLAQYWGRRDVQNVRRILGISTLLSIGIGAIFTLPALFFPEKIMGLFLDSEEVIKLGSDYLRIIGLSYIITGVGMSYGTALRSVGRPQIPMKLSAISFIVNTVFNYFLIFGKFGFPVMGVKGAALATLLARFIEVSLLIFVVYREATSPLAANLSDLFDYDRVYLKRIMRTVSPVIINEGMWALGQVLYSVAYARIGEQATAAVQLTVTVENIFFVLIRGLGSACAVMIGHKIGQGDKEGSYDYAIKFMSIAAVSGVALGLTMAWTPDLLIKVFGNIEPGLKIVVRNLIKIIGYGFFLRAINSVIVVGILRGGGDANYSLFLELGAVWLVGVPLAFIAAVYFSWPVEYVMIMVLMEQVAKLIGGLPRVFSKKWMQDLT